jgi:hypothetical protein
MAFSIPPSSKSSIDVADLNVIEVLQKEKYEILACTIGTGSGSTAHFQAVFFDCGKKFLYDGLNVERGIKELQQIKSLKGRLNTVWYKHLN